MVLEVQLEIILSIYTQDIPAKTWHLTIITVPLMILSQFPIISLSIREVKPLKKC